MKARNIIVILMVLFVVSVAVNIWQVSRAPTSHHSSSEESSDQLYTCGMHPNVIQEGPGTCPICGMNLTPMKGASTAASGERKILYWRAPMDPNYISDKPGKSPMGMDLVPVYEDEVQREVISVDPAVVQNIGVRTATVQRRNLSRTVETNGVVIVDESRTYRVNPKISGWIERLYINETGQSVSKGEPLLDIYSPELVTAQEEYLLALKGYHALATSSLTLVRAGSEDLLKAARERLTYWDITESQIDALESSGNVSRVMTLYSPASGVVLHKNAVEGGYAKAGTDLFQIADLSKIWVEAQIYEYELPWVKVGQPVTVNLPYDPVKVFTSEVIYIYPYLDPKTRTATIRIALDNPAGELKPDMYTYVQIETRKRESVVAIPREAVVRSGKRDVVFLALGEGKFLPREIELGLEADNSLYEVRSGLNQGDRVVTSAQFLLDSEAQLQEALQKLLSDGNAATDKKSQLEHREYAHTEEGHSVSESSVREAEGKTTHEHVASGVTMEALFTSDSLFWCPMHHEIITADDEARCPLCNMFLIPIPMDELEVLRHSEPYGCVMCPVVRPKSEKDKKCSVCGMFLKPIEMDAHNHSSM